MNPRFHVWTLVAALGLVLLACTRDADKTARGDGGFRWSTEGWLPVEPTDDAGTGVGAADLERADDAAAEARGDAGPETSLEERAAAAVKKAAAESARIAELRGAVPAPLLWGRLRPEAGAFVEYELRSAKRDSKVRVTSVGRVVKSGVPMQQVEFDFEASPRTLVVAYLTEAERPVLDRLVLWVPPRAPISVPMDLPLGKAGAPGDAPIPTRLSTGPFAGEARKVNHRQGEGRIEIVESDLVPVLGIATLQRPGEVWTAKASGTGAVTGLTAVPLVVPRIPKPAP